jgi:hypothetical protein
MNSSPFKCSLFWVSLVVVAAAAWLWNERQERHQEAAIAQAERRAAKRGGRRAQYAASLLVRAFHADNYLTYAATSKTEVSMGDKKMSSLARLVHAPRRLSIMYVQGDYAGLQSGYNEQWSWRQVSTSQPMIPYAEMERQNTDMAARRFALMLRNYDVVSGPRTQLGGREAEVVEIHPFTPAEGAQGPAKKLWIDVKTGLTLRMQGFNYQMVPVMDSVLSSINLAPQIKNDTFVPPLKLREVARRRPWMAHESGEDEERIARLSGLFPPRPDAKVLPAGFEFDSCGAHRCDTTANGKAAAPGCYAALSRFTDGLNTLTIFALHPDCAPIVATGDKTQDGSKKAATPNAATQNTTQSCAFGTGTLVMRDTSQGPLIAVADLPAPILRRVLDATTVRRYSAAHKPS